MAYILQCSYLKTHISHSEFLSINSWLTSRSQFAVLNSTRSLCQRKSVYTSCSDPVETAVRLCTCTWVWSVETVITIVANRLSAWCIRLMIGGNKGWGRDGGVVGYSLVPCRLAHWLCSLAMRKQPPPSKGKWLIVSFSLFLIFLRTCQA